jgi:hypothetical protein
MTKNTASVYGWFSSIHFHPWLIFARKVGACQSGAPSWPQSQDLLGKYQAVTNTLAYSTTIFQNGRKNCIDPWKTKKSPVTLKRANSKDRDRKKERKPSKQVKVQTRGPCYKTFFSKFTSLSNEHTYTPVWCLRARRSTRLQYCLKIDQKRLKRWNSHSNGRRSAVNRTLDGSTYHG